jgi:hypothetical protein
MKTRYARYKSFNFDMEALYDRIQAAKARQAEDAAEQARRNLGEEEQTTTSCNECPFSFDPSYCSLCQERGS